MLQAVVLFDLLSLYYRLLYCFTCYLYITGHCIVWPVILILQDVVLFYLLSLYYRPLHLLSAVTDETALNTNLEVLVACGVVMQLINLQNKYKQVG